VELYCDITDYGYVGEDEHQQLLTDNIDLHDEVRALKNENNELKEDDQ
jgi:hypothetical protein